MAQSDFPRDAFGDRFNLEDLPLPRPPAGYAVQLLDTDQLLDHCSGKFLPVRSSSLRGLFPSFDNAYAAACQWAERNLAEPHEHSLAIVPAGYDSVLERHILIYGVLCNRP